MGKLIVLSPVERPKEEQYIDAKLSKIAKEVKRLRRARADPDELLLQIGGLLILMSNVECRIEQYAEVN